MRVFPLRQLQDWVKLTTSTRDLSGVLRMGGLRGYRMEEVARHRTSNDAWAVFAGKVYNLTPYLPYHPGGANIIVKAAGTDCTALFNKHHPWVNLEGLAGVRTEEGMEGRPIVECIVNISFLLMHLSGPCNIFLTSRFCLSLSCRNWSSGT